MNEETLIFGGEKFISSRRAAKIFKYSLDYIGQLARGGKIESQMVGRTRFVSEASLLKYVHESNAKTEKINTESERKGISAPINVVGVPHDTADVFENRSPRRDVRSIQRAIVVVMLLLVLSGGYFLDSMPAKDGLKQFIDNASSVGRIFVRNFDSTLNVALITSSNIGNNKSNILDSVDDSVLPYFDRADSVIISSLGSVRDFILSLFDRTNFFAKKNSTISNDVSVGANQAGNSSVVSSSTTGVIVPAGLTTDEIRAVVREMMLREQDVFAPGGPYGGLVTLESSGDPVKDAQTIAEIKKTFSDEVSVSFDASGRSGIIMPVFRNTTDTSPYLFVLVPVAGQ